MVERPVFQHEHDKPFNSPKSGRCIGINLHIFPAVKVWFWSVTVVQTFAQCNPFPLSGRDPIKNRNGAAKVLRIAYGCFTALPLVSDIEKRQDRIALRH
jgi:hypothetical protein